MSHRGSDLFFHAGGVPSMRVDGEITFIGTHEVDPKIAHEFFLKVLAPHQQESFQQTGEADAAFDLDGVGRFRVNVFSHRGKVGFVCRHLCKDLPELADLMLPTEQLIKLARLRRGLVLVTGTAGSGKSTTLAAMIHWLNRNERRHVITLEDPIEFLFSDKRCTIHQRELGVDTLSFSAALKHAVRQSPDVIMVGEMRDRETVEAALMAAETGHLVFSTLHTVNASQSIERILWFFPEEQHALIRKQLSMLLEGVVSQRLLPSSGGRGRVPAVELMLGTPTVREMLSAGKTADLDKAIAEGSEFFGSMTFNQSLLRLVKLGKISMEDALAASDEPEAIQLDARGITRGGRGGGVFGGGAPVGAGVSPAARR